MIKPYRDPVVPFEHPPQSHLLRGYDWILREGFANFPGSCSRRWHNKALVLGVVTAGFPLYNLQNHCKTNVEGDGDRRRPLTTHGLPDGLIEYTEPPKPVIHCTMTWNSTFFRADALGFSARHSHGELHMPRLGGDHLLCHFAPWD